MKIGSLFSGYEGLGMAVQSVLGGDIAWVSDIDPGACKILAHRYPDVPNIGDITAVDWSAVEPVDVLTGGFPCTDVSCAGLRQGLTPDTRSGLWSQMAVAIDKLRPPLVVIENVRGLLSASAEHPAHGDVEPCPWELGDGSGPALRALGAVLGDLADIGYDASWQGLRAADVGAPHGRFRVFVVAWPAADAQRPGLEGLTGQLRRAVGADERRLGPAGRTVWSGEPTDGDRPAVDWGVYAPAIRRWEQLTRPAPAPTSPGKNGQPRLSAHFVEWLMGLPAGWVTDVPGLTRNEMLKTLGNGVVPQQCAQALRMLLPDLIEVAA